MLPPLLELQKGAWALMTECGISPQCLVLSCSSDAPVCKPLPVFHVLSTQAANRLLPFHRAADSLGFRSCSPLWTHLLKLTASLQQPGIGEVLWKAILKGKKFEKLPQACLSATYKQILEMLLLPSHSVRSGRTVTRVDCVKLPLINLDNHPAVTIGNEACSGDVRRVFC